MAGRGSSRRNERPGPRVAWPAVLAGLAVAFGITIAGAALAAIAGAAAFGVGAGFIAVAAGGYLAGRVAAGAGALQGAVVAALWIVAEAIVTTSLPPSAETGIVVDTATTVARDVILLGLGAAGGWLATRS